MSPSQLQTALAYVAHVDSRDYNALLSLLSDDFTHRLLPSSLKGHGMPVRTGLQYVDHLKELESVFESFNFQPPADIVEAQDVVVLLVRADGKTLSGKPYTNEYNMTIRFDGEKISSIVDFIDSKYITEIAEGEVAGRATAGR